MKNRKNNRQSKPYKYFTEEELKWELKDSCARYIKISKSIPIANEILKECGLPRCYYKSDMKEKGRHDKLYKIAMEKGIEVPQEWYEVNITAIDVLERVKTAYFEMINMVAKKSKVYAYEVDTINRDYMIARKKVCRLKKEDLSNK